jgi:hypothetical protein
VKDGIIQYKNYHNTTLTKRNYIDIDDNIDSGENIDSEDYIDTKYQLLLNQLSLTKRVKKITYEAHNFQDPTCNQFSLSTIQSAAQSLRHSKSKQSTVSNNH